MNSESVNRPAITINARKFDGKIHRSWKAKLIEQKGSLLIFVGEFSREVNHPDLGVVEKGTTSHEYYWLDRWYNAFRFHQPNGDFRNFYCNINMPPTFADQTLDYVDLDIDVLVDRDFRYRILDQEEFLKNSRKYNYPKPTIEKANGSLEQVIDLIEKRTFPFDFKV